MQEAVIMHKIGYYCGRFDDGFWGEPQNALSNAAFVMAALFAFRLWRRNGGDKAQLGLILMAAAIGFGSFIFHSMPNRITLLMDLVPIQIFGLSCFCYLGVRHFRASRQSVFLAVAAFFLIRQAWILLMPAAAFGGGITHIPTIGLLSLCGIYLRSNGQRIGTWLLLACIPYAFALLVRTYDLYLCNVFPFGLHWAWHLLTALAAGTVLYGLVARPVNQSDMGKQPAPD
jgi:hypothetical protein